MFSKLWPLFFCFVSLNTVAVEFRQTSLGTPEVVRKEFRMTLKECLSTIKNIHGTTAPDYTWYCDPKNPTANTGLAFTFTDNRGHQRMFSTASFTGNGQIMAESEGIKIELNSSRRDPSTGAPFTITREQAVREFENVFRTYAVETQWWQVYYLVTPR